MCNSNITSLVTTFTQIPGLSNVVEIATGWYHSLFLLSNGNVMACGANSFGQMGDGTYVDATSPILIPNLSNVLHIAAGYYSSYSLLRIIQSNLNILKENS